MSTATSLTVAVPAAVAGAASMGLASAAQARATRDVRRFNTLDPGLLRDLLRRPLWLVGVISTVVGLGLQLVALAYAPLILVQPLLVTSLVFGALFSALLQHRRFDRAVAVGSLVCSAGLATFLLVAQPGGQAQPLPGLWGMLPLAVALAAAAAGGLAVAAVFDGRLGVLGLALATGVFYGVTAGLMKVVAGQFRTSLAEPFQHWTLYVVCLIGPIGFLLSQNTFQRSQFISPALSVITTADPLVGVAIGVAWLGETAAHSPAALTGEVVAGVVIIVGIVLLTTRAGQLSGEPTLFRHDAHPRHGEDIGGGDAGGAGAGGSGDRSATGTRRDLCGGC